MICNLYIRSPHWFFPRHQIGRRTHESHFVSDLISHTVPYQLLGSNEYFVAWLLQSLSRPYEIHRPWRIHSCVWQSMTSSSLPLVSVRWFYLLLYERRLEVDTEAGLIRSCLLDISEALPGVLGNRGTRAFISGEQGSELKNEGNMATKAILGNIGNQDFDLGE